MEATLKIHGKTCRFAPDADDLTRIETALSLSLLALAKKLTAGDISLQELMVILENSIEADARKPNLREALLEAGVTRLIQLATVLFVRIFQGDLT